MIKLSANTSTTGYPSPILISNPSASFVDTTARRHLSQSSSPTTVSLRDDEPARDPLVEKYNEAHELLLDSKPEAARALFLDLIKNLPKAEANLSFLADCKFALTLTYPEGNDDRIQTALDAKKDLEHVYKKRNAMRINSFSS